jgi:hypothetical protein
MNGLNLFHEIKNKIHKKDVKDDKLIQEIYFVFKVCSIKAIIKTSFLKSDKSL